VAAGDPGAVAVFGVGDLTVGIVTCYDLRFPESARALVDRGATVLCVPAHWYNGPGKAAVWSTLLAARAIESTAYVVAACKPEPECVGRSAVIDPMGVVLAEAAGAEDGVAVLADCSAERVAEARRLLPVLEHRRYDIVPRQEIV
jgi:predicted amidohydrolase